MSIQSQTGACLQPRPPACSYSISQHSNRSTSEMGSLMLPFSGRMASWLYKAESLPKHGCQQECGGCSARWPLNQVGRCHSFLWSYLLSRKIYLTPVQWGTVACCAPGMLWDSVLPREQDGTLLCKPQYAVLPAMPLHSFMWLEPKFASRQGAVLCLFITTHMLLSMLGILPRWASTFHPLSSGL